MPLQGRSRSAVMTKPAFPGLSGLLLVTPRRMHRDELHLTFSAWSTVQSKRRTTGVCGSGLMACNFVEVNNERGVDGVLLPLLLSSTMAKNKAVHRIDSCMLFFLTQAQTGEPSPSWHGSEGVPTRSTLHVTRCNTELRPASFEQVCYNVLKPKVA